MNLEPIAQAFCQALEGPQPGPSFRFRPAFERKRGMTLAEVAIEWGAKPDPSPSDATLAVMALLEEWEAAEKSGLARADTALRICRAVRGGE